MGCITDHPHAADQGMDFLYLAIEKSPLETQSSQGRIPTGSALAYGILHLTAFAYGILSSEGPTANPGIEDKRAGYRGRDMALSGTVSYRPGKGRC